jgi:hypothetical protein
MEFRITEFSVEDTGSAINPFAYELELNPTNEQSPEYIRGDGIIINNRQVRFNRRSQLNDTASKLGLSAAEFEEQLLKLAARYRSAG